MVVTLKKGGNTALGQFRVARIGLGWSARATSGEAFDLDASAFMLAVTGKVRSDADFIFYNQPRAADGSVEHTGDNRTGDGDGDDEAILIDLSRMAADVSRISITVTIHEAVERRQNFGMISDAYIRIVDESTGSELVRYDLGEDFSAETAVIFGDLYRHDVGWKFRAVGQGFQGGLESLVRHFGVQL